MGERAIGLPVVAMNPEGPVTYALGDVPDSTDAASV